MMLGIELEQAAEGPEPVGQALGVVQPVDADDLRAVERARGEQLDAGVGLRRVRHVLEGVDVDADREIARHDGAAERGDLPARLQHAAGLLQHIALEIGHVRGRLEADDVVGEQRLDQPGMVGHRDHHVRRRERDMQEEADAGFDAAAAQLGGERDQVIVVDPDQVRRRDHLRQVVGDHGVDAPVALDEGRLVVEQAEAIVERRPQHLVGISEIVGVVFVAAERNGRDRRAIVLDDVRRPVGVVLDDIAVPSEPEAAGLLEHRADGDGEPAGLGAGFKIGHAVRNDDEPAHTTVSQGRDNRIAPLTIPTME